MVVERNSMQKTFEPSFVPEVDGGGMPVETMLPEEDPIPLPHEGDFKENYLKTLKTETFSCRKVPDSFKRRQKYSVF